MAKQGSYVLISNGSDATDQVAVVWPGGPCYFVSEATWGGGSNTLSYKSPNGTWINVPSGAHTADTITALTIPAGEVRVTVVTATAVYSYLIANPDKV